MDIIRKGGWLRVSGERVGERKDMQPFLLRSTAEFQKYVWRYTGGAVTNSHLNNNTNNNNDSNTNDKKNKY
jgi:hypothetical protein